MARENLLEHPQQIEQTHGDFRIVRIGFDFGALEDGPLDSGPTSPYLNPYPFHLFHLHHLSGAVDDLASEIGPGG